MTLKLSDSFNINRIRLILKQKKTDRNLINFILCSFGKLQFVEIFLS
jgi:hypothetical protein